MVCINDLNAITYMSYILTAIIHQDNKRRDNNIHYYNNIRSIVYFIWPIHDRKVNRLEHQKIMGTELIFKGS